MSFLLRLEGWPRVWAVGVSAALIVAFGLLDFVTGYQLNLNALYLAPIFVLSWRGGGAWGLGGALGAATARTLVDLLSDRVYPSVFFAVWNVGMRLMMFCAVAVLSDAIRAVVEDQRMLARIDHLTGAANKLAFEEVVVTELDRSRRYGHPFTLAYFDLDNFKAVNDSLGHVVGDRLLRNVAGILRRHVRTSDVVARLGGDEFGVLLPETDESAARAAILKIRSEFENEMDSQQWPVTVSIGSLTCVADGLDVDQLLARADRLMYSAKVRGKNTVQFAGPEAGRNPDPPMH